MRALPTVFSALSLRSPFLRVECVLVLLSLSLSAAVVDRIAVVVGKTVITETEVLQEARLEAFLNQTSLDISAQGRKTAAEHLIDQQLVRNEMRIGSYPKPTPADVDSMLRNFRQEHFTSASQYRAALEKYGITEDQLKDHLSWQLAAIRFTDLRFGVPGSAEQSADRVRPGVAMPKGDVDQQMDAWLKQARAGTKVQFKPGAFQ
jgi:parvulin-like peptidyl-prolyl isomerase